MTGRCCKTRLTQSLCKPGMFILFFVVLCLLFPVSAETSELSISLPETVRGYTPCEIVIQSPAAGEAELKLFDGTQNLWLVLKAQLTEGKNVIPWDGLGELMPGDLPENFNPVACYVKYFRLPEDMKGKWVFVSFQGAESCVALWMK